MQPRLTRAILPLAIALVLPGCATHFAPAPVVKADASLSAMPQMAAPQAAVQAQLAAAELGGVAQGAVAGVPGNPTVSGYRGRAEIV